ncbi:MAG: hypothetical protein KJP02_07755 [Octadecabacter sp.]|nr:hypothetical protein [Octadecabacter sp.]
MQPRAFLLIALLAPQTAAAFGDLDCISIESCTNGECAPASDPFALTFDWVVGAATVTFDGIATTLPLASPITTQTDEDDQMQTVVEYGVPADADSSLLRVEAAGNDILAYFSFQTPSPVTIVAQCNRRQAA